MEKISARKLSGKIPIRPDKNPYTIYNGDENAFLHIDMINFNDTKTFPYPEYQVVVYMEEPIPPCFYVYYENTAIAVDMQSCKVVAIKRKGRNPKNVKKIISRLDKWLRQISTDVDDDRTNLKAVRDSWFYPGYLFSEDGHVISYDKWCELQKNQK